MPYKCLKIVVFVVALLGLYRESGAQNLWSGVLSSTNGANWTQAGVTGGIPSSSWTQCTTSACSTVTSAGTGATAAQISAALQSAPADTYVLLASGTYTLSTGIDFGTHNNVVLRGAGAGSTKLHFTGTFNCGGYGAMICVDGYQLSGTYVSSNSPTSWTGGYSQGTTAITVASIPSGAAVGGLIVLDQCDTGFSTGTGCTSGNATDNGNYFNCGTKYSATGPVGCSENGPDGGNGVTLRFQSEVHTIAAINTSTDQITLAEPITHANFVSGQTPQVWAFPVLTNDGVENLTVDGSAETGWNAGIYMIDVSNIWVSGVAVLDNYGPDVYPLDANHVTIQSSYFWENQYADDTAVEYTETSYMLAQNNICQQHQVCMLEEGPDAGSVFAYNLSVGACNYLSPNAVCKSDAQASVYRNHSNGDDFDLWEGNIGVTYYADGTHGSHLSNTLLRNFLFGWESCGTSNGSLSPNGPCGTAGVRDFDTNAIMLSGLQGRYHYIIANVLGTPKFHTDYQYTSGNDKLAVYNMGAGYGGGTPVDPLVASTSMRWGNYDVANAAIQWNITEVPSSINLFPNIVPSTACTAATPCPASFYLASRPTWWSSSIPFPAIGPDVTGGNVGQCTGTLNAANTYAGVAALTSSQCTGTGITPSAWGGHVNATPAMACYFSLGGTPDGTGAAPLAFDAGTCYGGSGSTSKTPSPTPPVDVQSNLIP